MKYFIQNYNQVMTDLIKEIDLDGPSGNYNTNRMAEADVVILWSDVGEWDRTVITSARSTGKKVIVIQHGRKGTSRYYPPFNEPISADKLLVWGQADKDRLIKYGHSKKKIEVVGTTIFSHLKPREEHKNFNIVFSPEHWGVEVPENRIVAEWLNNLKGVKITTKLLPEHNKEIYKNPLISDRNTPDHFDIVANVLKTADIVVAISESTFELLAQSLDIPVIIADIWQPKAGAAGDERYKTYLRTYSNACTKVKTEEEMRLAVEAYRNNPGLLREERKQVCIDEGGINLNTLKEIKRWI